MRKTILFTTLFACWALASVLSGPSRDAHASTKQPLLTGTPVDPHVLTLFERSCQNCHSSNTEWPIYGRVFPMSLLLQHDISTAKSHMDLSRWAEYDDDHRRLLLAEIGVVVRDGRMPPRRYTLLHPEAQLTPPEINAVYEWTRATRKSLKQDPLAGIKRPSPK